MPVMLQPGSPEAWREKLLAALDRQAREVAKLERYYDGDHPIPDPPRSLDSRVFREAVKAYRTLAQMGVTNFCRLIADAPANRLAVTGFRFTARADEGDDVEDAGESRDEAAWAIWQRSHLDADQALVHATALYARKAYALVWGDGERASITVEHPGEMIVAYASGSRRQRAAALKSWRDDDGVRYAVLYRPDGIYKWRAEKPAEGKGPTWARWQPDGDTAWPVENELGVVPVVEFRANPPSRPSPYGGGRGEYETVLPIQDRVNKTQFDRLVTAEFQAFRQRYVIGWQPPEDPETGQPDSLAAYRASVARLQIFNHDDPEALAQIKAGEYAQADFSGFLKGVEADVQQMAAITETPAYYLLGQMVNISSDALIAAEAGLVAKVRRHMDNFAESWEEVVRLALAAEGDPGATDVEAETLWRDPEQRTWGQTVDAVLKMQQLGVPLEALWGKLPDATPQEIARWRAMQTREALFADTPDEPAPAPPGGPPAPVDEA